MRYLRFSITEARMFSERKSIKKNHANNRTTIVFFYTIIRESVVSGQ